VLARLLVKNIGLIDQLEMEFSQGFNVLTGETGASKTIILMAANLLTGGRAQSELIKTGAETAHIEGVFNGDAISGINSMLETMGIPAEPSVIIKRVFKRGGSSQIMVNGSSVQLKELEQIGPLLLDYSGQMDKWQLFQSENQLAILDGFASLSPRREVFSNNYRKALEKIDEIEDLRKLVQIQKEETESLRFRLSELDGLSLDDDRESDLLARARILKNSQWIAETLSNAQFILANDSESVLSKIKKLSQNLALLVPYFPEINAFGEELHILENSLSELNLLLEKKGNQIEFDPEEADAVEMKLSRLSHVKRKYQKSLAELALDKERIESDLANIGSAGERLSDWVKELNDMLQALTREAHDISLERKSVANLFSKRVSSELTHLGFPKNSFLVWFDHAKPGKLCSYDLNTFNRSNALPMNIHGADEIAFLFQPNPGESAKELKSIASGGELSRVLLAIKSVVASSPEKGKRSEYRLGTMILDEIDSGIGGEVAHRVADLLSQFSRTTQVICISHLPQIAAVANRHFHVCKKTQKSLVKVEVELLNQKERMGEISRMIGGDKHTVHTARVAEEMMARNAAKE
jgi:DNA repair protein RecN (Recombination protein N)